MKYQKESNLKKKRKKTRIKIFNYKKFLKILKINKFNWNKWKYLE